MRIAQCLEVPLMDHGGVEVLVRELVRGLTNHGDQIYLVAPGGVDQSLLTSFPEIVDVFTWNASAKRPEHIHSLIQWMKRNKIDLVHFHLGGTYGWDSRSWKSGVITRIANQGIPCVSTNHGAFGLLDCVGKQRSLAFKLAALPYCWSAKLRQLSQVKWEATVSRHDFLAVKRDFFPLSGKFRLVYHSRMSGRWGPSIHHEQTDGSNSKKYILCLGTLGPRKGQTYLVEAFLEAVRELPDWELVLAGRQVHQPTLESIHQFLSSSAHADRVRLMGEISDSHANELLHGAGMFVMPSVAEGLGLSLQEALAFGIPSVGTRVGGITDMIIHEKTGLLVPPSDSASLKQAILRMASDENLRERCSKEGILHLQSLGMDTEGMILNYRKLYHQTLSGASVT